MRVEGHFRDNPGAAGVSGVTMQAHHDRPGDALHGTTIAGMTAVTGADGYFSHQRDFCPGPHYWRNTVAYDGQFRILSTRVGGPVGAVQAQELAYLLEAAGDGVIDGEMGELAVTAGTGRGITVATGAALVRGVEAVNYTADTNGLTAGAADATNPRIDTVVIEVGRIGQLDEGRSELKLVAGTPAASPVAPALTQTAAVWQFPLADVRLNAGATSLTSVTDRRVYLLSAASQARNPEVSGLARRTDPANVTVASTTGEDVTLLNVSVTLLAGVVYDITAEASLLCYIDAGTRRVEIAPYIGGTANAATYLGHNSTDYETIFNFHSRLGVVGTGAAVACGVLVRKTAGTSIYRTGALLVRAVPRS